MNIQRTFSTYFWIGFLLIAISILMCPTAALAQKEDPDPPNPCTNRAEDKTISRAAFSRWLVYTLQLQTTVYSPFPFFKDVPREHRAYIPIETLREKQFGFDTPHGYFLPRQRVQRQEVWKILSDFTPIKLASQETVEQLMEPFTDHDTLSHKNQQAIAKLLAAGWLAFPKGTTTLNGTAPITCEELRPSMTRLASEVRRLTQPRQLDIAEVDTGQLSKIPGGITLTVTPSAAILQSQLIAGTPLFWIITAQVPLPTESAIPKLAQIPEGARIKAEVQEANQDRSEFNIQLKQLIIPNTNQRYRIAGTLRLSFKPLKPSTTLPEQTAKETTPAIEPTASFLVTGQTVTVVTE